MRSEFALDCRNYLLVALLALPGLALTQDPLPSEEALHDVYPKQDHYSPYANRNFPTNVYWSDTHVHTGMSMDADAFGARLKPADAYRFARGEELTSSTGQHLYGKAIDIRLTDVELSRLRDTAIAMQRGGVGYYASPNFVHIDTGRVRRW